MLVRPSDRWNEPVEILGTDRNAAGELISDVPLHVCVDEVLRRNIPVLQRVTECVPIFRMVDGDYRSRDRSRVQRRPSLSQRLVVFKAGDLSGLGIEAVVGRDRAEMGLAYLDHDRIRSVSELNDLLTNRHISPGAVPFVLQRIGRVDA